MVRTSLAVNALRAAIEDPSGLSDRLVDRLRLAHDASHFLLHPAALATPTTVEQVRDLMRATARAGGVLTFRSGGTSLSGQAVTDGVLVDTRRYFRSVEVLDGGLRVRVQPGATLRQVNARLAPFGRKLGPDPASEVACTIGGIVANNSSGMTCGIEQNSYCTLDSALIVLPSGTTIDTAANDASERLRVREPLLFEGLCRLRDRVRHNPKSVRTIRERFAIKNTMGYSLNAFVDFDDPISILAHLIVGSEGTLAFLAEATFHTVPVLSQATTGLLVFESLAPAAAALPALLETGPSAAELLDAAALRVAQQDADATDELRRIDVDRHAALLVEYRAESADALAAADGVAHRLASSLPLATPAEFTTERRKREQLWHMRKNLYAAIAAARPTGTNALLEDVAVPVPKLLATCGRLVELFAEHGYENSAIFGHARDGNLHFTLIERFDDPGCLQRYQRFTDDLVDLVLGQGGSLKAEHGTGRMMAPYVRRQYGDELYDVMWELKWLFDPAGILNPGVVLSDDPAAHLRHLKATPASDPEVDRCVECGYCEPVCPSRDLTTTPRQRIVLRREWVRAKQVGERQVARELERGFGYDVVDTCAVDAMCQTACPVLINTGDLVKRLRAQRHGRLERSGWLLAARHWAGATRIAAIALSVAKKVPSPLVTSSLTLARRLFGPESVPLWSGDLPRGGHPRPRVDVEERPAAVFFPSCLGQLFAPARGGLGVSSAFLEICRRAGVNVMTPPGVGGLCCGTPWASKGLGGGYGQMRDKTMSALLEATGDAGLPVLCDASSCTEGMRQLADGNGGKQRLRVVDVVDYVAEELLPCLTIRQRLPALSLHPTCASTRLGSNVAMLAVANAIADEVVVAADWGCCGFAGDRGLLRPELTSAATRGESAEVGERHFNAYASCNRTCEIGMTRATGHEYQHIIELVELLSRP